MQCKNSFQLYFLLKVMALRHILRRSFKVEEECFLNPACSPFAAASSVFSARSLRRLRPLRHIARLVLGSASPVKMQVEVGVVRAVY